MCLIIYAPKGVNKNTTFLKDVIKEASEFNPDGYGYAVKSTNTTSKGTQEGYLYFSKGFFEIKDLLADLEALEPQEEDELVVHCRIGNKGEISPRMSHPFKISDKKEEIYELDGENPEKGILFHNGTFGITVGYKDTDSDTFLFTQDYMSDDEVRKLLVENTSVFEKLGGTLLKNSRVVYMNHNDPTVTLGNWYEEEGILFSKDIRDEYYQTPSETTPNPKSKPVFKSKYSKSNYDYDRGYNTYDDYYDDDTHDEWARNYNLRRKRQKSNPNTDIIKFPAHKEGDRNYEVDTYTDPYANVNGLNSKVGNVIPNNNGKLIMDKDSGEKRKLILVGDNLYIPKEDGFSRKTLNNIYIPISQYAHLESKNYNGIVYVNYFGILIPAGPGEFTSEDYLLDVNQDSKDLVTVFAKKDMPDPVFGAIKRGEQYWIEKIDSLDNVYLTTDPSSLDSKTVLVDKLDLYEDFVICPLATHRYIIRELDCLIRKFPHTTMTLIDINQYIEDARNESRKIIFHRDNLVFRIESCIIFRNMLHKYLSSVNAKDPAEVN